jgi:hypothetical protein
LTGEIERPIHEDKSIHFSDDAFRVLWRVALDWEWHQDPRAYAYLSEMDFFERSWQEQRQISGAYTHDGELVSAVESNSVYAVVASSFASMRPEFSLRYSMQGGPRITDRRFRRGLGIMP